MRIPNYKPSTSLLVYSVILFLSLNIVVLVKTVFSILSNYKIIYLNLGNPIYTVFTLLLIAIFYYTIRKFLETKCSYKFLTNLLIFLIVLLVIISNIGSILVLL